MMKEFKEDNLPTETKNMHESREIWMKANWEKTLKDNNSIVENLIKKIKLFNIWSNKLRTISPAKMLIREIFTDAYISIHFSCLSLYKYAYVCLRSELETTLRLVYFSTHKIEFNWWSEGNEWHREKSNWPDVWGRGYNYFAQLNEIKNFEKLCSTDKKLFSGGEVGISKFYKQLSKFIHTGAGHFQTRANRISPKYDLDEFNKWCNTFDKVQIYIHIILALGFPDKFKGITSGDRNNILNIGMNTYYKSRVKEVLGI